MTDQSIALVTGANRGIGLEVSRQLARLGYTVIAGSRDLAKGRQALGNSPGVTVRQLDVTDLEDIRALRVWVEQTHGRLDVLVNNAAINYDTWHKASDADLAEVHQTLEANLFGAWRLVQAFLPLLITSPHGRIVNVSSESGSIAGMGAGTPGYSVSKAALNALTRNLAAELRHTKILVNAVCPGWTDTDMGGGGRPVSEGAASVIWAVTLADDGPSGGFFRDGKPLPW